MLGSSGELPISKFPPPFSISILTLSLRRVLYFPVSALLTLFANVIHSPTDSRARSDLRLMKAFVEFLAKLQHEESGEIRRIFKVCSEFERIARDAIAKARDIPAVAGEIKSHSQGPPETVNGGNKREPVTAATAAILTPESSVAAPGTLSQAHLSGGMIQDSSVDNAMNFSQFNQYFPDKMGRTLNPYPEAQPMLPHGLTLPWNMNSFEGSMLPDSFSNVSYNFDPNG